MNVELHAIYADYTDTELEQLAHDGTILEQIEAVCESARTGNLRVIEGLCRSGISQYVLDGLPNQRPLSIAVSQGLTNNPIPIINMLLDHGADINITDTYNRTHLQNDVVQHDAGDVVKLLVGREVDVNVKDQDNRTVLHEAVSCCGTVDVIRLLIDNGADVSIPDNNGRTPLHEAARKSDKDVMDILIGNGANVCVNDNNGRTPLHEAMFFCKEDVVDFLIDKGANVCAEDNNGRTPLHEAIAEGSQDTPVVTILIHKGARICIQDHNGRTPLHESMKNPWMATCAMKHVMCIDDDITVQDNNGRTALHEAVKNGMELIVRKLINKSNGGLINVRDINGSTPLHEAVKNHSIENVKLLLNEGAEVFTRDINGRTAFHEAADRHLIDIFGLLVYASEHVLEQMDKSYIAQEVTLIEVIKSMDSLLARLVLDGGADVTCTYEGNNTILHEVIDIQEHSTVRMKSIMSMLINKGADITAKNNSGDTPFRYALRARYRAESEHLKRNIFKTMGLLLEDGFLDGHPSHHSTHPDPDMLKIWINATNSDIKYLALQCLADHGSETAIHQALVDHTSVDVHHADYSGKTLLHKASYRTQVTVVEVLTHTFEVDVNAKDVLHRTPLHEACGGYDLGYSTGFIDTATTPTLDDLLELVNLLLEAGAEINASDSNKSTPLHAAASINYKIVGFLIDKGANVNAKDARNTTPLHIAATSYNSDISRLLLDSGADVNAEDNNSTTPLHNAVTLNHSAIAKLLLEAGAHVNAGDRSNISPLHNAAKSNQYSHPYTGMLLLEAGAEIDATDDSNHTPLHKAAELAYSCLSYVILLIDHGADVNARNIGGRTPLHFLCSQVEPQAANAIIRSENTNYYWRDLGAQYVPLLDLLFKRGADVNSRDCDDATPLHHLAKCGIYGGNFTRQLLKRGADPHARDCEGNTPVQYASDRVYSHVRSDGDEPGIEWLLPWQAGFRLDSLHPIGQHFNEDILIMLLKECLPNELFPFHRLVQCGFAINRQNNLSNWLMSTKYSGYGDRDSRERNRFQLLLYLMSCGIIPPLAAFSLAADNFLATRVETTDCLSSDECDTLIAVCFHKLTEVRSLKILCRDKVRGTLYYVTRGSEIMSVIHGMSDIPQSIKAFLSLEELDGVLNQTNSEAR